MEQYLADHSAGSRQAPPGAVPSGAGQRPGWLALLACLLGQAAPAATLVAVDDGYGVPYGGPLQVEPDGVLGNDTVDGAPAVDAGTVAELLAAPSHGILRCPGDGAAGPCPDGSFEYTPDAGFSGSDAFTYRLALAGASSAPALVSLSACSGGPGPITCWQHAAFLAKVAELGYSSGCSITTTIAISDHPRTRANRIPKPPPRGTDR